MDPLLRRSFEGSGSPEGAAPCPDPELLAAFADGGLADEERRAIVEHAADCGRCSAVLALAVAADENAAAAKIPAPVLTSSRWRHAYWSVPLATAATIAGLWVATPREAVAPTRTVITSADPAARVESQQAQDATGTAPSAVPESGSTPSGSVGSAPDTQSRVAEADSANQERRDRFADASPRQGQIAGGASAAAEALKVEEAVAPPPPPAAVAQVSPATPQAAPSAAAAPPGATRPEANTQALARSLPALALQFASPDGQAQWRIAGTAIERSADRGVTWVAETRAPRALTSGVAVTSEVAWAAGEGGLVLRRTAGGWAPVTAATAEPIVSIRATSATDATVTLASGRALRTTDAGATWQRAAGG